MPATRIAIIDAHPDPDAARFCDALARAYAEGAEGAGLSVRRIDLAGADVPMLRKPRDWTDAPPPEPIRACQDVNRLGGSRRDHLSALARHHAGAAEGLF
jgi:putative NADPH-quinone reductase